ncbi:hypothetical protein FN976_11125 [Caenimonas sedimenti]|uniref:Type IV secretion system protein n=1 Tax=Caenimonas sedimenti TaxID=2596921 RepID=A0A562ZS86_9BURK|nr:type IV secretion system protein [Caenimonas sedimenti]TWO71460.1 hypothetical protein FN976_11125 [Caenimonas sedimenti]
MKQEAVSPAVLAFANFLGALAEHAVRYAIVIRSRMGERKYFVRAVLLALCIGCTFAFGQAGPITPPPTTTPSTYAFSASSLMAEIGAAVTAKLTELENNSSLQGFGKLVTGFFLILTMIWAALRMMAGGRGIGELIGEWVPIFVCFGIVTMFLDRGAANLIVATMDGIGSAIGGANMSTLDGAINAGAAPIFKAIAAVVDQPRVTEASGSPTDILGRLGTIAAGLGSMLMMAIAKILTAFILVIAGVIMVANVILGFISVRLVLALAPVMVPFLMFRPLGWLFDAWLKFLLGACMLKIVTAFLLNVAAGLLTTMSSLALKHYTEAKGAAPMETLYADVVLFGMMLVFAILASLLVAQAPSIATGLLSGSAGGIGFAGIKGLTQSVGGRVSSGTVSGVSAGAGAAAAQGARNGLSYRAGRKDAQAGRQASLAYRDPRAKAAYATAYRKFSPPKPPSPPTSGPPPSP